MPTYFRPRRAALTTVVPDPLNGSTTTSPGLELDLMIRSSTAIGIWHPCQPSRSLNVPQTRLTFHVSESAAKNSSGVSCGRRYHVSSGTLPLGFARASAYVVWRAEATRIGSALNVKSFGSGDFVKYRMCVWLLANFCFICWPNV